MAEVIGGLAGSLQGTVQGVLNTGQGWLDKLMPPERRAELWARFQKFSKERPMLASFLLSHIALSGLPIGLFVIMTITIGVFTLLVALIIALLVAVLFIVAAVGFALLILLPVLFFTTFAASFLWLWGVGAYYILKWFNQKEIPGIHTDLKGGLLEGTDEYTRGEQEHQAETGSDGKTRVGRGKDDEKEEYIQSVEESRQNQNGASHKGGKKEPNGTMGLPVDQATNGVGKATGVKLESDDLGNVKNVTKKADVGNVKKSTDGVTKKLPGDPTKKLDAAPGVSSVKGNLGL